MLINNLLLFLFAQIFELHFKLQFDIKVVNPYCK